LTLRPQTALSPSLLPSAQYGELRAAWQAFRHHVEPPKPQKGEDSGDAPAPCSECVVSLRLILEDSNPANRRWWLEAACPAGRELLAGYCLVIDTMVELKVAQDFRTP
jgi:hypothetical protein